MGRGLRIRVAKARLDNGAAEGNRAAAKHVLGVSQNRVPLEEGDLLRTGRVVAGERGGTKTNTVVVTYGGQGLRDYARRQHEELTWRHAPGRTAKYLEGPLFEEAATVKAIVAAHLKRAIR